MIALEYYLMEYFETITQKQWIDYKFNNRVRTSTERKKDG